MSRRRKRRREPVIVPPLDPETGLPPVGVKPLTMTEALERARAKRRHGVSPARKQQR